MKRKAEKPKRRSRTKHRAILDAAAELLCERGYCSVTIDQVAARAGVGKQTIYRWWNSKIALFIELYDEIAKRHIVPIDTGSLTTDMRAYAEGLYTQLTHPVANLAFRGMVAEAQDSKESLLLFQSFMVGRFAITRTILRNAVRRGEVPKSTDIDAISSLVGGAAVWRVLLGNRKLTRPFLFEMAEIVTQGLVTRRDAKSRLR